MSPLPFILTRLPLAPTPTPLHSLPHLPPPNTTLTPAPPSPLPPTENCPSHMPLSYLI